MRENRSIPAGILCVVGRRVKQPGADFNAIAGLRCSGEIDRRVQEFAIQDSGRMKSVRSHRLLGLSLKNADVYSDGFPDAEHRRSGRRFGSNLVAQAFSGCDGTASKIIQGLVEQVDQFMEDSPQFDDMCMVCLRRIA